MRKDISGEFYSDAKLLNKTLANQTQEYIYNERSYIIAKLGFSQEFKVVLIFGNQLICKINSSKEKNL